MRRWVWVVAVLGMVALLSACEPRDEEEVAGARPATQSPAPQAAMVSPAVGPPITKADVTFTHPVDHEGRTWWPAAGYRGGIIFDAERPVRPAPGEPTLTGPERFDQQFWWWDAASGGWTQLWANGDTRHESVLGIDGDWALSLLYRSNPADDWVLRVRNLATGETRDVASVHPAATTIDAMGASMPSIGDGVVAYAHKVLAGDELVERLELYDLASGTTNTISESAASRRPGATHRDPSLGDGRLAWAQRNAAGTATDLVVHDLATGARETIASSGGESWLRLMRDGRHAIGLGGGAAATTTPRDIYVRDLDSGETVKCLTAVVWGTVVAGDGVSWWGAGGAGDPRGYYDAGNNELRTLDSSVPAWGQSGSIVEGWFFWAEGEPRESAADRDTRVLHFVPIP